MKKKSLIAVGLIAVVALVIGGVFVATRNNGNDAEPVVVVDELPELKTQEIETVESEPEVEEVEEIEEVKVEAESNGVSEDEEVKADEQESIVAVVEDDEEEAEEVNETATTTSTASTQTTETASTTQSTASNQNVDTAAQERMLQKAAENGFSISNGDTNIVEAGTNDMSGIINDVGMWE